jgi:redox-sensing transcriptional repressor
MVRNGITSVLNFAPVLIEVPEGVDVRRVDLATELQILAFHEQRKSQSALTQANAG